MKMEQMFLRFFPALLGVLYLLLYMGYNWVIEQFHASFHVFSLSAILLPLLLFLSFRWRDRKHADAKPGLAVTLLGSIPPLYSAILLGINEYESRFTVEKWLANPRERVYMVDDLIDEHPLIGRTQNEVMALLGPPTETGYFQADDQLVYYLGDERGLIRIDSEWLILRLDESGNVAQYEIVTD